MSNRPRVVAVVVTYEPEPGDTSRLLAALTSQVAHVVVVDNSSSTESREAVDQVARSFDVELVSAPTNLGIATAQNLGIERARARAATHVLLSDQDSLPAPDMVARLLAALDAAGPTAGAVGPISRDTRSDDEIMVYASARWGPRRSRVTPDEAGLVPAAFLLASGCLIPIQVLDRVGPMRDEWFIDHVDLEWGLRARRAGFTLYGVAGAHLDHRLGDRLVRIPGRRQEVHVHNPVRCYYLARNTVLLIRSGLMPVRWQVGYVVWLAKYTAFNAILTPPRRTRAALLARGALDGLRGTTGPLARR